MVYRSGRCPYPPYTARPYSPPPAPPPLLQAEIDRARKRREDAEERARHAKQIEERLREMREMREKQQRQPSPPPPPPDPNQPPIPRSNQAEPPPLPSSDYHSRFPGRTLQKTQQQQQQRGGGQQQQQPLRGVSPPGRLAGYGRNIAMQGGTAALRSRYTRSPSPGGQGQGQGGQRPYGGAAGSSRAAGGGRASPPARAAGPAGRAGAAAPMTHHPRSSSRSMSPVGRRGGGSRRSAKDSAVRWVGG